MSYRPSSCSRVENFAPDAATSTILPFDIYIYTSTSRSHPLIARAVRHRRGAAFFLVRIALSRFAFLSADTFARVSPWHFFLLASLSLQCTA